MKLYFLPSKPLEHARSLLRGLFRHTVTLDIGHSYFKSVLEMSWKFVEKKARSPCSSSQSDDDDDDDDDLFFLLQHLSSIKTWERNNEEQAYKIETLSGAWKRGKKTKSLLLGSLLRSREFGKSKLIDLGIKIKHEVTKLIQDVHTDTCYTT